MLDFPGVHLAHCLSKWRVLRDLGLDPADDLGSGARCQVIEWAGTDLPGTLGRSIKASKDGVQREIRGLVREVIEEIHRPLVRLVPLWPIERPEEPLCKTIDGQVARGQGICIGGKPEGGGDAIPGDHVIISLVAERLRSG